MKEFDINLAKAGKPVCTRDGRKARIICFDAKGTFPIIALVDEKVEEFAFSYTADGNFSAEKEICDEDLMMLPEKHEGWINIYKKNDDERYFAHIYDTKALAKIGKNAGCIATVRIEWEE